MLPLATGVSNIFYLTYLLFILPEKTFPILISKLLNKSMILTKFFSFFKDGLHPKPRWSTIQRSTQGSSLLRFLKNSSKRSSCSKEASISFCISLLVFFNLAFLNFGLRRTCSFSLHWKLQLFNFSTWKTKSGPNIISSYFTLTDNGNQRSEST